MNHVPAHQSAHAPRQTHVIMFILLSIILITFTLLLFGQRENNIRQQFHAQITSIINLKAEQVSNWHAERIADGEMLRTDQLIRVFMEQYYRKSISDTAKTQLRALFQNFAELQGYNAVSLIDSHGKTILSTLEDYVLSDDPVALTLYDNAMLKQSATMSEIYVCKKDSQHINLSLAAPVIGKKNGHSGVLIFDIAPGKQLYPLLQLRSMPNRSAEVILVHNDGDHIIYLNGLQHNKNNDISLRHSHNTADRLSLRALSSSSSAFEEIDYKGMPVLASVRAIPGTSWQMMVKIDRKELDHTLRYLRVYSIVISTLMIILIWILMDLYSRRKSLDSLQRLYLAEREKNDLAVSLTASEERFKGLFNSMIESVSINELVYDKNGEPSDYRILDANPAYKTVTGLLPGNVIGRLASELYGNTKPILIERFASVVRTGQPFSEEIFVADINRHFKISAFSPESNRFAVVFNDITERKTTEQERETTIELFRLINANTGLDELLNALLTFLSSLSGCDSVGIRLNTENSCPISRAIGFLCGLIDFENCMRLQDDLAKLISHDNNGVAPECRDSDTTSEQNNTILQQFTARGSFWVNSISTLFKDTPLPDNIDIIYKYCIETGYESVAIIALRFGLDTPGFLLLCDKHDDLFSIELVERIERLADNMTIAIEQRLTSNALAAEKDRLLVTLRSIGDGVITTDVEGKIILMNRMAEQHTGYTSVEACGQNLSEVFRIVNSNTHEPYINPVEALLTSGGEIDLESHTVLINKNGIERSISCSGATICNADGNIIGVVIVFRDVTEKELAEDEIKRQRDRAEQYLDTVEAIIVALDRNGKITMINRKGCVILGYKEEELIGKNWFATCLLPPVGMEVVFPEFMKIISGDIAKLEYYENAVITRTGKIRHIAWHNNLIRDSNGFISGTLSAGEDITEKYRSEKALQKAAKLESLGVLAGGIAHDFNNLLGGLFGYLDLARESIQTESDALNYLDKAFKVFNRAKNLTGQLLTFAKGGAPARKTQFLPPFIINTVQFILSGSTIKPVYFLADDLYLCDIDENQMGQVLDNIVINARDAMPDGGTITVYAENVPPDATLPPLLPPGSYVRISISDEGGGIAPEHVEHLFDPFFTTKCKGSGLGLAISYSIVKRHNGTIEVESTPGEGTTFHIYLPVSCQNISFIPQETKAPGCTFRDDGKALIMDDEEYILEIASKILGSMGYDTHTASSGEEAVTKTREAHDAGHPFVLALLDLTIPGGMGGIKTNEELKKICPEIKVIASSGYSEDPVMAHPQECGFDASVSKPYIKEELEHAVELVMTHHIVEIKP